MLAIGCQYPPLAQQGCGVVALFVYRDGVSDHDGQRRRGRQGLQSGGSRLIKSCAQQQVFRRVPAQGQFRGEQHMRTLLPGLPGQLKDALSVARDISDHRVELGDSDAQHAVLNTLKKKTHP
jgi:hypothetical protein